MKVIALLVLSMAVVVCEQQTLFAPHYKYEIGPHLKAPNPTGRRNSLRPAARVNRLAPVNSSYAAAAPPRNDIWVLDTGAGLRPINDPDCPSCFEAASDHNGLQPTPDPSMNLPEPTPVERPVLGPVSETCPPCQLELGPGGAADPRWDDI